MKEEQSTLKQLGAMPPKGFRDFLPAQTAIRDHVLNTILATYRSYGFERVETPVVEDIRRLTHSEGGENLGLLFRIMKRGLTPEAVTAGMQPDELADMGLRYDLTVPLARYYANNRSKLPAVFKAVQIGSVWRAEKPQQGRYRQFTQCDIDIIGGKSPESEVELITVTVDALGRLEFPEITVRLNDRRILSGLMERAGVSSESIGHALVILDKMDKIGLDGVRQSYLAEGFASQTVDTLIGFAEEVSKLPAAQRLDAVRRHLGGQLPESVFQDLATIQSACAGSLGPKQNLEFDPFLVRGMGYYTGPVFEIATPESKSSVAGGGRYDKLIGKFSGIDVPACGFSIGFERIVSILEEKPAQQVAGHSKIALFYEQGRDSLADVLAAVRQLQKGGAIVSMVPAPKNMKVVLDQLKQIGFTAFGRFETGKTPSLKDLA